MIAMQRVEQVPQLVDRGRLLEMDRSPGRGPASPLTRAHAVRSLGERGVLQRREAALAIEALGDVLERDHQADHRGVRQQRRDRDALLHVRRSVPTRDSGGTSIRYL